MVLFPVLIYLAIFSDLSALSQEKNIFKDRRKKLAAMVEKGIVIIKITERKQSNLHEYFVPNSDNHDFIYLTGLKTPNATLIICPGSKEFPEILYIKGDHEDIKRLTKI